MSTITQAPPTTRVSETARIVDELWPGWEWKVNPAMLVMASVDDCVLGQITNDYEEAYLRFDRHVARIGHKYPGGHFAAQTYSDDWREEIAYRRQRGTLSPQ